MNYEGYFSDLFFSMKHKSGFFLAFRQRNGDWELKYPVGQSTSTAPNSMTSSTMSTNEDDVINCANPTTQTTPSAGTTLYHETSNLEDILSKIRAIVQPSSLKNYSNEGK